MGKKDKFYSLLDKLYIKALTNKYILFKKETLYHPVKYSDGVLRAKREQGSIERLELIDSIISKEPSSVLDIGSAEGFFSMALAQKGNFVTAFEGKKQRALIGQITARIHGIKNVSFYNCNLDIELAKALPVFDNVLCLAVWHHWVKLHDLEYANALLKVIWSKTNNRMFFETGLTELPEEFNLKGRDEAWLIKNLKLTLGDVKITELGKSSSFSAETFVKSSVKLDTNQFQRVFYVIEKSDFR